MNDINKKILEEFLIESFENLSCISEELTRYEKMPNDSELLNAIYRKVHTLKGSASFLGFGNLEKITHHTEDCLNKLQEDLLQINSNITDILLESFDICFSIVREIESNGKEPDVNLDNIIIQLNKLDEKYDEPVSIKDDLCVSDYFFNLSIDHAGEASVNVETKSDEVENTLISNPFFFGEKKSSKTSKASVNGKSSSVDSTIRVNISLLDKLMNVVGELVLNRNQILQHNQNLNDSELTRLSHQLNVITTELQTDIMSTRMQPVGNIFTKYERVIRDLANKQKKKISLEIIGGETELDKSLLEVINDPMTHLVRNAVDHGIEIPEERMAKGKSEEGRLIIKAYHEGGQVNIDIIDDGKGISRDKIIAKAISKEIITEDESQKLSDQQVYNLIFTPGFSTAEEVTNISGRGVGMDVVKTNIEKVGGKVQILTTQTEGSIVRLKIPLTLAIVPALTIKAGDETFAIPQKNLLELVLLNEDEEDKIEVIHGQEFYRLRGDLIPIFELNKSLNIEKEDSDSDKLINIAFLNAEGNVYGLIVDEVKDTQEIVVKPLSNYVQTENIFAGATLMGDGKVALILDAFGFYNLFNTHQEKAKDIAYEASNSSILKNDDFELLLCNLSDKRTYGIPLCLVNRLEEFKPSEIVWSGAQALIKYRNRAMPLINLETALNLNSESSLLNQDESKKVNVIVVEVGTLQFGVVVKSILEIATLNENVDEKNTDRKGLMGTIFFNEELVCVIDIHELISIQKQDIINNKDLDLRESNFLIVDDSSFYRKMIGDLLESLNATVHYSNDGTEGLKVFKDNQENISFIVTDIEMPEMNGDEFADEVRNLKSHDEVPILAVSSLSNNYHHSESFSSRIKKFDQKQFINEVTSLLKRAS